MANTTWKNLGEMVKALGEEKTFKLATAAFVNQEYRKKYNMKRDALLELAKKDVSLVKKAEELVKK